MRAALAETATIAGAVSSIPASDSAPGRSPDSRPASTDRPAAATALIGLTTLKAAYRNPVNRAISPPTPQTPAAAPHPKVSTDGGLLLTRRTTGKTTAALSPSATTGYLQHIGISRRQPGRVVRSAEADSSGERKQNSHHRLSLPAVFTRTADAECARYLAIAAASGNAEGLAG
jgi:hypothetical protein